MVEKAASGFRRKIFKSAGLSSAQFFVRFGLRLISTVVLTRLLAPEIYGIFAVVLVYQYVLEMLSDLGLRSFVITKEGALEEDLIQTCWTISILRGLVILAGSGLIALVIAVVQQSGAFPPESAYNAPVLPWAIFALGFVSLILSCQSINLFVAERDMKFLGATLATVYSSTLGLIVTIATAYIWPSVWALVIGMVAQNLLQVAYTHLAFAGPKMRFRLVGPAARLVIQRGKWLVTHSTLTAVTVSADRFLLGILLDSTTFGLYFIALQIREFCSGFLNMIHASMGMQVFTHLLQAPSDVFRKNYYKYRLFFDAMAGLGAGALIMLAEIIIAVVFDDRYEGVAPILQILALSFVVTGPLLPRAAFNAERKFREMAYLSVVTTATIWIGLAISVFVLNSMTAAFFVIALHQLPEAILLGIAGARRNWVIPLYELMPGVFLAIGLGLGWALAQFLGGMI